MPSTTQVVMTRAWKKFFMVLGLGSSSRAAQFSHSSAALQGGEAGWWASLWLGNGSRKQHSQSRAAERMLQPACGRAV